MSLWNIYGIFATTFTTDTIDVMGLIQDITKRYE